MPRCLVVPQSCDSVALRKSAQAAVRKHCVGILYNCKQWWMLEENSLQWQQPLPYKKTWQSIKKTTTKLCPRTSTKEMKRGGGKFLRWTQTHRPKHTEVKNIQGAHTGMKVTFETKVTSSALLNIYQTDYLWTVITCLFRQNNKLG